MQKLGFAAVGPILLALVLVMPGESLAAKKKPKAPPYTVIQAEDVFTVEISLGKKKKKTVSCLDADPGYTKEKDGQLLFYSYAKLIKATNKKLKKAQAKGDSKTIAKLQKKIAGYKKIKKKAKSGCKSPPFFDLDPYQGSFGKLEARHICDRIAFGCSDADVDAMVAQGLENAVNNLLTYHPEPQLDAEEAQFRCHGELKASVEARGDVWEDCDALDYNDVFLDGVAYGLLYRFAHTTNPAIAWLMYWLMDEREAVSFGVLDGRERWAAPRYIDDVIKHAAQTGDFRQYIEDFNNDYLAAIVYLHLGDSDAAAPNEDQAREIQELGTIGNLNTITGELNYTNVDIAAAACAMAGWVFTDQTYFDSDGNEHTRTVSAFSNEKACKEARTLYAGTPYATSVLRVDDVIEAIFTKRANDLSESLAKELWVAIIGPNPSNTVIKEFAQKIRANDFNLLAAIGIAAKSKAMFDPQNEKAVLRSPLETAIAFERQTGFPFDPDRLFDRLGDIGQAICYAPSVFGWYEKILLAANKVPDYYGLFLDLIANNGNQLETPIEDGGLGYDYQSILANLGSGEDSVLLVDRMNSWMNLHLNQEQKDALVTFLDYRWETCDYWEVQTYGCTEGEKFAKRDAFDSLDPNASQKLLQFLYLLTTSPFYAVK